LAVGIPVPYPDFDIMNPSSSTKSLKRSRSKPHIHRGDVSSSAASSPYNSEDEDVFNTPKRKVVGVIEPATVGRQKAGSRETLQARLQQAAKLKKSRSIGDGLGSSSSITHLLEVSQSTTAKVKATTQVHHGGESSDKSDKVVVCVR
jgi:centromeric protein E